MITEYFGIRHWEVGFCTIPDLLCWATGHRRRNVGSLIFNFRFNVSPVQAAVLRYKFISATATILESYLGFSLGTGQTNLCFWKDDGVLK